MKNRIYFVLAKSVPFQLRTNPRPITNPHLSNASSVSNASFTGHVSYEMILFSYKYNGLNRRRVCYTYAFPATVEANLYLGPYLSLRGPSIVYLFYLARLSSGVVPTVIAVPFKG